MDQVGHTYKFYSFAEHLLQPDCFFFLHSDNSRTTPGRQSRKAHRPHLTYSNRRQEGRETIKRIASTHTFIPPLCRMFFFACFLCENHLSSSLSVRKHADLSLTKQGTFFWQRNHTIITCIMI